MRESYDWYTLVRRLSFLVFILLTFWAVVQATSLFTVWNGMQPYFMWGESLKQAAFVIFWPIAYAPIWFKFVYFTLGLWLILPYVMTIRGTV